MKYISPKAEVISFETEKVILLSELLCIIYDAENPSCEDKLPDFYG